jgi:MoaA/NifB/PqqE/SkfB family radical SAM enzyme
MNTSENIVSKIRNLNIPTHVQLEITKKCNLHCCFCYAECDNSDGLPQNVIFSLLDDLKKMGTLEINFTGGEPLMRKDIFNILRYAKKLGFSITLNTNATLLSENNIDELQKLVSKFEISLHSYKKNQHDSITGVQGSYDKTKNSLSFFKDSPEKVLLKCVLTSISIDNWMLLKEFSDRNGFMCSFDTLITPTYSGNTSPLKYQITSEENYGLIRSQPVLAYRTSPDTVLHHLEKGKLSDGICSAGRTSAFIDSNGYCFPCITFKTNPPKLYKNTKWVETIKEKSFSKIWENNVLFNDIRSIIPQKFVKCLHCSSDMVCIKCIAKNWKETGDFYTPSSNYCELSKKRFVDWESV